MSEPAQLALDPERHPGGVLKPAATPESPPQLCFPAFATAASTCRLPIPETWRFTHLLPRGSRRVHGTSEASFFAVNTPTKPNETLDAFVALHHSIAPGVSTADLSSVRTGRADYQRLGFKRLEIATQSTDIGSRG